MSAWHGHVVRLPPYFLIEGKEPGDVRALPTQEFQRLMANWATGVTVVTSVGPGGLHGMTANAFLSVSLEPPLVLVSIGHENDSNAIIRGSGRFAVSILSAEQEHLSRHFAQRFMDAAQALRGIAWSRSPGGLPWLDGALAHLDCEVQQTVEAQDHTLFLGRVLHLDIASDAPPLLYFRSRYPSIE